MATKKAGGSTRNGRDSQSKRRGVKLFGDEIANEGSILVRQKGTQWHPGENVGMGKDFTLYAKVAGRVTYTKKRQIKFDGRKTLDTVVHVIPA